MLHRFLVLLLLLGMAACSKESAPVPDVPKEEEPDGPVVAGPVPDTITYLALGDSYTIGQAVDYGERWPVQLVKGLRTSFADTLYYFTEPDIVARTGWRTDQLLQALEAADTLRATYNMVSLLIGVNNQFQGRPIAVYKEEFSDLLARAIGLANGDAGRVFVLSIPDYAYTPFGQSRDTAKISREIDAYNALKREITDSFGVAYFDITPISRRALAEPHLLAADRLHPSGRMYTLWVEVVWEEIGRWF